MKRAFPEKAAAISEFKALKHQPAGRAVHDILNILIEERRVQNDTAEMDIVKANQGAISVLKSLLMWLEKGD